MSGPFPAVVLIHGGGWRSGDKRDYADQCRELASRGFVAATINYRLSQVAVWPAQLVDAQLAVRWLRGSAPSATRRASTSPSSSVRSR